MSTAIPSHLMYVMFLLSGSGNQRRKDYFIRGTAWNFKRSGSRNLSMVTSSSTLAAYGAIGAGIPPYEIKQIVTVCKAYSPQSEQVHLSARSR